MSRLSEDNDAPAGVCPACVAFTSKCVYAYGMSLARMKATRASIKGGGGAAWLRPPFDTSVRTAGSLVAAEVGHALVQARAADAHER